MSHRVSSGMNSTAQMARENPMGALIGGMAAGLVLGLLVPKTRFEQERFGEQASNLMNQATERVAEVGHRAVDKEKEMVQRAGDQATDAVQNAGSSDGGGMSSSSSGSSMPSSSGMPSTGSPM